MIVFSVNFSFLCISFTDVCHLFGEKKIITSHSTKKSSTIVDNFLSYRADRKTDRQRIKTKTLQLTYNSLRLRSVIKMAN